MSSAHAKLEPSVGLILSGGGARAAYQVGVLQAIVGMLPDPALNPFAIICGTSAGAINAASLASHADRFDVAVWGLSNVWGELHLGNVFRADLPGAARTLLPLRCGAACGGHAPAGAGVVAGLRAIEGTARSED
jgi:NTE family protein